MPGFLSPGKGVPLLLIPEYSGINKGQTVPDRSKTAHRKPLVKCFLTPWRRERLTIPVFWPEEFHGLYSPWDNKESDTTVTSIKTKS